MVTAEFSQEFVVLVDGQNNAIGTWPKESVHTANTPLHRAFSTFLFNERGQILLQQRSRDKKTWPLMWSNSCCGHPFPNESTQDAVRRRVAYELGIDEILDLREVLPHFRYRAERDGIVEHEICPVWVGTVLQPVRPNPTEVEQTRWTDWEEFVKEITEHPYNYSEWAGWEVAEIVKLVERGELILF